MVWKNLGNITNLANDYLPKSAIDRTTIRMAELLQHRMGASMVTTITSATTGESSDSSTSSKESKMSSSIITK